MKRSPPVLPTEERDLKYVVQILGAYPAIGRMWREDLARLVGRLPESKTEAQEWKCSLRALWREVRDEPDLEVSE